MGGLAKAAGGLISKAAPMVMGAISGGGKEGGGEKGGGGLFGSLLHTGLNMLSSKDEEGHSGFEKAGSFMGDIFGKGKMGGQIGAGVSSIFDAFTGDQEGAA